MKERCWGESPPCVYYCVTVEPGRALRDYRTNRENGDEKDNPNYEFPRDGAYTWATPDEKYSKLTYTEGPGDRAWMEEKDRNYLRRIARTDTAYEKEQLANAIQHLTSTDQNGESNRESYGQFFADEIKNFKEEQLAATNKEEKAEMFETVVRRTSLSKPKLQN